VTAEDFRNRDRRPAYLAAIADMFAHTNTRWAPWHAIDGNNKKAARIAALTTIADALERKVPMKAPEADAAILALADKALGKGG
jgi:polyphosphate kinase 2 (PPK2 family)